MRATSSSTSPRPRPRSRGCSRSATWPTTPTPRPPPRPAGGARVRSTQGGPPATCRRPPRSTGAPTPAPSSRPSRPLSRRSAVTMRIRSLDHLVLTVSDIDATVRFYERIGMRREVFGGGRIALRFGDQKLNLHEAGAEPAPHAARPTRGSADLCCLVDDDLGRVAESLSRAGIAVELGPVDRTGATSALSSLYVRDPDGNLVELAQSIERGD